MKTWIKQIAFVLLLLLAFANLGLSVLHSLHAQTMPHCSISAECIIGADLGQPEATLPLLLVLVIPALVLLCLIQLQVLSPSFAYLPPAFQIRRLLKGVIQRE